MAVVASSVLTSSVQRQQREDYRRALFEWVRMYEIRGYQPCWFYDRAVESWEDVRAAVDEPHADWCARLRTLDAMYHYKSTAREALANHPWHTVPYHLVPDEEVIRAFCLAPWLIARVGEAPPVAPQEAEEALRDLHLAAYQTDPLAEGTVVSPASACGERPGDIVWAFFASARCRTERVRHLLAVCARHNVVRFDVLVHGECSVIKSVEELLFFQCVARRAWLRGEPLLDEQPPPPEAAPGRDNDEAVAAPAAASSEAVAAATALGLSLGDLDDPSSVFPEDTAPPSTVSSDCATPSQTDQTTKGRPRTLNAAALAEAVRGVQRTSVGGVPVVGTHFGVHDIQAPLWDHAWWSYHWTLNPDAELVQRLRRRWGPDVKLWELQQADPTVHRLGLIPGSLVYVVRSHGLGLTDDLRVAEVIPTDIGHKSRPNPTGPSLTAGLG